MTGIVGAFVLTAGLVTQATGGRLVAGSLDRVFTSVSTDTRALSPGALFIGLRGERFDGESFVDRALDAGAAGLLLSHPPAIAGGAAVIIVPDSLLALQALGQEVRRRSGARVVAITGSTGKTTTKEMIAELLSARYDVFRSRGNLNNHIGLPLSLIELRSAPDVAVVELGMNHAGEIRRLVELAEPDVRVWTNVGDAHIGFLGSREAVADAKAEVLELARRGALVVANADDPLVMSHVRRFAGRVVTFGEHVDATIRLVDVVDRGLDGTEGRLATPAGSVRVRLALPGRMQLMNAAAAVAVATEFHITPAEIESRLASLTPLPRRGAIATIGDGIRVIDDSYNASPEATIAMLTALGRTPAEGRRIAVLGEMLELGSAARRLHETCGKAAAEAGVDLLVVVGGRDADGFVAGAQASGLSPRAIHRFAGSAEAAVAVRPLLGPGDVVLVKGSRGTLTDLIVDRLVEGAG